MTVRWNDPDLYDAMMRGANTPSVNQQVEDQLITNLQSVCNNLALVMGLDFDGVRISIEPKLNDQDHVRRVTIRTRMGEYTVGWYFMAYDADLQERVFEQLVMRAFCFEAPLIIRGDREYIRFAEKLFKMVPGETKLWRLTLRYYLLPFHRWKDRQRKRLKLWRWSIEDRLHGRKTIEIDESWESEEDNG